MAEEGLKKTGNQLIHIGKPISFDSGVFWRQLEELAEAAYDNSAQIAALVQQIVPTYHPPAVSQEHERQGAQQSD